MVFSLKKTRNNFLTIFLTARFRKDTKGVVYGFFLQNKPGKNKDNILFAPLKNTKHAGLALQANCAKLSFY